EPALRVRFEVVTVSEANRRDRWGRVKRVENLDDVTTSVAAWRKAPLLPTVTTLLAVLSLSAVLRPLFGPWAGAIILPC
ncbi:MAG TPA: hypothetical protein VLR46_12155, partial [Candidatus Dormibacteraeota bacterium]|nr:hypothetical protein [Candidatus Dormibacteraeota bacterium]